MSDIPKSVLELLKLLAGHTRRPMLLADVYAKSTPDAVEYAEERGYAVRFYWWDGEGPLYKGALPDGIFLFKTLKDMERVQTGLSLTNRGGSVLRDLRLQRADDAAKRPAVGGAAVTPDDLIVMRIALDRFNVSRATLKRAVDAGELKSYRRKGAPPNAAHIFSERELAVRYERLAAPHQKSS